MHYMQIMTDLVMQNLEAVLLSIVILLVITVISFVWVNIKLSKVMKRYHELMRGMDNVNLEELLQESLSTLRDVCQREEEILKRIEDLQGESNKALKKIGFCRYDAFKESGGKLSFSLALLNEEDSGVVLTGIYGREESRVFLKPIDGGNSERVLSPEEVGAIAEAKGKINLPL